MRFYLPIMLFSCVYVQAALPPSYVSLDYTSSMINLHEDDYNESTQQSHIAIHYQHPLANIARVGLGLGAQKQGSYTTRYDGTEVQFQAFSTEISLQSPRFKALAPVYPFVGVTARNGITYTAKSMSYNSQRHKSFLILANVGAEIMLHPSYSMKISLSRYEYSNRESFFGADVTAYSVGLSTPLHTLLSV